MLLPLLLTSLLLATPGQQHGNDISSTFNRAVELQRQGAWKDAEAEYRAVIALAPNYAEAHANLGAVLSRQGRYAEAISAFESARRLNPTLTPVFLNLGIAHYRAGQFEKAVVALIQFLAEQPDNAQAHQLIGLSFVELGRYPEAIAHLEPLLSQTAPDVTMLYGLGLAYLRTDRREITSIEELLANRPDGGPLARLLRGQALLESLEFQKAATELEAAAKDAPDLPRLQFSLGLAYLKLARYPDAKVCLERELIRTSRDFSTLYYLAYVLEKQSDLNGARQGVEAALQQEPESVEAATLLGTILLKLGQTLEAVRVLETAVARQPQDSELRYLLGRGYQKLGRKQDAAREFAEVERLKAQAREREKVRKQTP
jgi:tetratricopeptide (TPR) repeat protein